MKFIPMSDSFDRYRFRKVFNKKQLVKPLLLFLVGLIFAGYFYESINARHYVQGNPGNTITVNQVRYNYQVENRGGYTIIVDGAAGESLVNRTALLQSFEDNARIFFYERPGYGRTEGPEKTPRELAEDLHFMFRRFGWNMRFIWVGEEFGSLVMQEFINLYPEEILGAVFINPLGPKLGSQDISEYVARRGGTNLSDRVLGIFGVPRLLQNTGVVDYFRDMRLEAEEDKDYYANLWLSQRHLAAAQRELAMMETLDPMPVRQGLLGEQPVVLLTTNRNLQQFQQSEVLRYSRDQETVIVSDSVQDILLERTDEVAQALRNVIMKVERLERIRGN